jgi:hypothetical protein
MKRVPGSSYLDYWITDAPAFDYVWDRTHVLRFMQEGAEYTVELFWDTSWGFLGWYVNLQAPLKVGAGRFDTTDWALDVWVDPDGSWSWKDEEDFERVQQLGVLSSSEAAAVRAVGERVIAERPWPTGWEDWRPPTAWRPLTLPDDWDVLSPVRVVD